MRAIGIIILLASLSGGYYYFIISPTKARETKTEEDHSSLIGKETPLVNFSTERQGDASKGTIVIVTAPKISLVGAPTIAAQINKTIVARVELLTGEFNDTIASGSTISTSSMNTYALIFTERAVNERVVAFDISSNTQMDGRPPKTTSDLIAFRLDTGALIDKDTLASFQ